VCCVDRLNPPCTATILIPRRFDPYVWPHPSLARHQPRFTNPSSAAIGSTERGR
jgi:hypothetical protein